MSDVVYATAEQIRMAMDGSGTGDDVGLLLIATAVSRWIDGYMGYKEVGFVASDTATNRIYAGDAERYLWIDPCIEITAVTMKDSVTDTAYNVSFTVGTHVIGFRGDPKDKFIEYNTVPYHGIILLPNATRSYFTSGKYASEKGFSVHQDDSQDVVASPTVQVMAKWGYSATVPEIIKQATVMQSIRYYKRQRGAMADAVLSGDFNIQQYNRMLDPDIKALLTMSRLKHPVAIGGR